MDNRRIPKQILFGELAEGTRNVGQSKLRFKGQCKTSMIEFSINFTNWDMIAQDRVRWRAAVLMGAKSYGENRVQRAVENRQRCKCPTVNDFTLFYYTVGIVRNRADRAFDVSAMSGAVFQDQSFSAASRRRRRKDDTFIRTHYFQS